jgi:hypothetical protein
MAMRWNCGAFPGAALMEIDPFLLLDEMGPMEFAPGDSRGCALWPVRDE